MENHLKIDNKTLVEPTNEKWLEGHPKDDRGICFYKKDGQMIVGAEILHHMVEVKQDGKLTLWVSIDSNDLLVYSFTSTVKNEAITLPMSIINRLDENGNRKRVLIEDFDFTIDRREEWCEIIYLTVNL